MQKRFVYIWFCHLVTDWFTRRNPHLSNIPFILAAPDHGRMIVAAANGLAYTQGIEKGIAVADARVIITTLEVLDDKPELPEKLLKGIAEWCIRYTPIVAVDLPDGLILDATGCTHLWSGEQQYISEMLKRLKNFGYSVKAAIADTIGTAFAVSRYGKSSYIIENGKQAEALQLLPSASLRIDNETAVLLEKLGLRQIKDIINLPRTALKRRFGASFLLRLDQALGHKEEGIIPVYPAEPYHERLPCLEPIITATGIEIALERLLDAMCKRLKQEEKGLRKAIFKCYRMDGKVEKIEIGTHRPSANEKHLFKLFENKIETIEPALGIELFILEAPVIENLLIIQERLWNNTSDLNNSVLSELLDKIEGKFGPNHIYRYVPDEHYWPERSFKPAAALNEKISTLWKSDKPRPLQLLGKPEPIEVTAPVPDYPPMMFRYKGKFHKILRADGPERIEQEWWLQQGQHRDYYYVEDEEGYRYWLFRLGHYDDAKTYQWYMHGFFA